MKNRTIILFLFICLLISSAGMTAFCGEINSSAGTSAFPFLKINVSARSVAMGGAFTGLADDESALYYNPAGLTIFDSKRFILGYHNYFYDMQTGFVGYIKPISDSKTIGFYMNYLNYGDFTETNDIGEVTGDFSGGDLLLAATLAIKKSHKISYGGTLKLIYEKLQEFSSTGTAIDLAIKYRSDRGRLGAGLMLQNLGTQLSALGEEKYSLPTTVRGGISYNPRGLPLTIVSDLILPFDNDFIFSLGGEYHKFNPLYLRLGWNSFGDNYRAKSSDDSWAGLSMGVGFDVKKMQLSYSFSPSADLGQSHRITITGEL